MSMKRIVAISAAAVAVNRDNTTKRESFESTGRSCDAIVAKHIAIYGEPGLSVCVSVNGKTVWAKGFGYADIENAVPCTGETVMRIASISKPITATIAARLWQDGKLDLDKDIKHYLPDYPQKTVNDVKVTMTTRQLLSHLAGIRHYKKEDEEEDEKKSSSTAEDAEKYSAMAYDNVTHSLTMFKDDKLLHAPGSKFYYTTHGYTLLSAVLEKVAGEEFIDMLRTLLAQLGMKNTVPDQNSPIIHHRARQYERNDKGMIVNAPYVDCSYKLAGGGIVSNVYDITKFGNIMLYCYQKSEKDGDALPGYLNSETIKEFWKPISKRKKSDESYSLGWCVTQQNQSYGMCRADDFQVNHTGGATGGSTVLFVRPTGTNLIVSDNGCYEPQGIVVTILTNINGVNLVPLANKLADQFQNNLS